MIFNVIWTYALVRGAAVNTDNLPYGNGAFFSQLMGWRPAPARPHQQRVDRDDRAAAAHRRHAGLPTDRAALQAPAHRAGAGQRHIQEVAQRPGPAAAGGVQGRADRLRGSRRGRGAGPRQDRGLHLEGLPGLHHMYRVRPLPVAVPGLEHRQTAVSQARDHEPARPLVRQGAIHPRRQGDAAGEHAGGRCRRGTARREARRGTPHVPESGFERVLGSGPSRRPVRWSAPPSRRASSTPTCCGRAPRAVRASSSARWTSSTSTTSSTCAAIR